MPRYFAYLTVLAFVTIGAWGFGDRRPASDEASDSHDVAREPAADSQYPKHMVDSSGGGSRGLAVLDKDQVEKALAAELTALGVTEQSQLGEHPACKNDDDTACMMNLAPVGR